MMILGLLLLAVSVAGTALVISYNNSGGPEQTIVLFGRDWLSVTPLQAFIAGLVVALVFCLGIWMIVSTGRQRRALKSETREARREARTVTRERDQLARELADRDEAAVPERPAGWTPPPEPATGPIPVQHQGTTQTQGPPEPRRGFGRHFRRSERPAETEAPASSTPPSS